MKDIIQIIMMVYFAFLIAILTLNLTHIATCMENIEQTMTNLEMHLEGDN